MDIVLLISIVAIVFFLGGLAVGYFLKKNNPKL